MNKKSLFFSVLTLLLVCHIGKAQTQTYATVPYFCDFEDSLENALWNLPNNYPLYYGKWFIGSYVSYSGNHSLYNTYDDGVTNICSSNVSPFNQIWSYREFYLDTLYPQYVISFKHRGYGRTTPYFGPSNNTTLKQLCSGSVLPYDSVWMDHNYTFSVDTPGVYRLSFRWYKSSYDNGNPGISIDDISITGVPCLPPNTLTTTNITDSSPRGRILYRVKSSNEIRKSVAIHIHIIRLHSLLAGCL